MRGFGQTSLNGSDLRGQWKGRRIGLNFRRVLALGEVRAGRPAVVVVEKVVDQMRREREQVGGEQAHRQTSQEPPEPGPHRCCYSN